MCLFLYRFFFNHPSQNQIFFIPLFSKKKKKISIFFKKNMSNIKRERIITALIFYQSPENKLNSKKKKKNHDYLKFNAARFVITTLEPKSTPKQEYCKKKKSDCLLQHYESILLDQNYNILYLLKLNFGSRDVMAMTGEFFFFFFQLENATKKKGKVPTVMWSDYFIP